MKAIPVWTVFSLRDGPACAAALHRDLGASVTQIDKTRAERDGKESDA